MAVYNELYPLYRKLYFGLGSRNTPAVAIGDVLPGLRDVAERVRRDLMSLKLLREEVLEANLELSGAGWFSSHLETPAASIRRAGVW